MSTPHIISKENIVYINKLLQSPRWVSLITQTGLQKLRTCSERKHILIMQEGKVTG
jgi:hypothetical protein